MKPITGKDDDGLVMVGGFFFLTFFIPQTREPHPGFPEAAGPQSVHSRLGQGEGDVKKYLLCYFNAAKFIVTTLKEARRLLVKYI